MSIAVRGIKHQWIFHFDADPKHLAEWRADGLDVHEVEGSIPDWLPAGLTRAWCFAWDIFHFRNPFRA